MRINGVEWSNGVVVVIVIVTGFNSTDSNG